ncbi:uncharacterized protein LOC131329084 [Rhododendron vialii]|uniref:uncharacterized protein LOC131329084 n=1 Tax=Rhododendron vialii TaxID=182163 RepID=UPI00265DBCC0|nr:uncharacterized protein LOC131329084 [Rhododendron vialii]
MTVIKEIGYSQQDNISVFYRLPNTDMNNGLVALTSHDEMLNMFATHSPGMKYFSIDIYVDCPNVVDSEDEEVIGRDTNTVDEGCLIELGVDLQVEEGQGGVDLGVKEGHEVVDLELEGVVQGVDANETGHREIQMDDDDSSDIEWLPYDDGSTSTGSFSGVEESSDEEEEDNLPLVGLGKNLGQNIGDEQEDLSSNSDDNNLVDDVIDEDGKPIFPEFKEHYMKKPELIEGMKFPNVQVLSKLLREYHIKEGYIFTFLKNESKRVTMKCTHDCGFRLHVSLMYEERSFQIKKINQQ